MNTPKILHNRSYLLVLISTISRQIVGKQMIFDFVIVVRPALDMASMKLSFSFISIKYIFLLKNNHLADY